MLESMRLEVLIGLLDEIGIVMFLKHESMGPLQTILILLRILLFACRLLIHDI